MKTSLIRKNVYVTQKKGKRQIMIFVSFLMVFNGLAYSKEYHVSKTGSDLNKGTPKAPFLTIQHAADLAQPGDTITVHKGLYREEITPPRGGLSDEKRIVYQAALGEVVEIRGSEVVKNWMAVSNGVWRAEIDNSLFGDFNPFADEVSGPWFSPNGPKSTVLKDGEWLNNKTKGARKHHSGCVYIDGESLLIYLNKTVIRIYCQSACRD